MRAAIVSDVAHKPIYGRFAEPEPNSDEVLVQVRFAAQSSLTKAQASGKHYSGTHELPFIPGTDGVGVLGDGTRVYFAFPRPPFGAMAEYVAVPKEQLIRLPSDIDDSVAAAVANPGMSSVAALVERARFSPGDAVLVNGATSFSGHLAIKIAKYLGASSVIATGRNKAVLTELLTLGADAVVPLDGSHENLVEVFREVVREYEVDVILDYIWGQPAAAIIDAISGAGTRMGCRPIRFIQIGHSAGEKLTLDARALRSSGLELLGSGLGSVSLAKLMEAVDTVFQAFTPGGFQISIHIAPLESVESAWDCNVGQGTRLVFEI